MYAASASCCALTSSSVSGRGIGASCGFSTYAALLAAVTVGAAQPYALPPSRNAAEVRARVFFHGFFHWVFHVFIVKYSFS